MEQTTPRIALEPTRRHGKLRAAALLQAGAAVIAERGFEAATMAEIAARAGAPIGSLYRFFPSKQVLGEALSQRFGELLVAAFEGVGSEAADLSAQEYAEALLAVFVDLRSEMKAFIALLDAHSEWSSQRSQCHANLLQYIAGTLKRRNPALDERTLSDIAIVLLQNIKMMLKFREEAERENRAGAIAELCEMTRLYIVARVDTNR